MTENYIEKYDHIRNGGVGFYEQRRGLIAVWGKEAVQFLNGLMTNDIAKLNDGEQMSAAFPNAQGRLLAAVRVLRKDDKFLFETEDVTREKVYKNLFRFTFAGDFFVEDLSETYSYFSMTKDERQTTDSIEFQTVFGKDVFVTNEAAEDFRGELKSQNAVEISDELHEVLRVENGVPLYGIDADETTIVPELGDDTISYNKGCYIGQEIIARIHFRGHVAKKLTGVILESEAKVGDEFKSVESKSAGKITSVVFSPKLEKFIALAFVRYDYLAEGTALKVGEAAATVKNLPFVGRIS